ncbi:hypothetical protein M404DRAFT_1002592 [Pisolithus tinctorius Marx 270]|uniref:Uncharacterized protein n=1 Tax=Pisolithus tinctorius Marx 270 TaxID=870435 RepID=A0A0C3P4H5_PISTI|nr:hypothetical protein M404DRAFT_1002592 [Pisolithus tinctorius Marx 270]
MWKVRFCTHPPTPLNITIDGRRRITILHVRITTTNLVYSSQNALALTNRRSSANGGLCGTILGLVDTGQMVTQTCSADHPNLRLE